MSHGFDIRAWWRARPTLLVRGRNEKSDVMEFCYTGSDTVGRTVPTAERHLDSNNPRHECNERDVMSNRAYPF